MHYHVKILIGDYPRYKASINDRECITRLHKSWAEFTNDFRETLTYGEFLKHEVYLILRTFG